MIDPTAEAVLVRSSGGGDFADRTDRIDRYTVSPTHVLVTYRDGGQRKYRIDSVCILRNPVPVELRPGAMVATATRAIAFSVGLERWTRVFYRTRGGERFRTFREEVRPNQAAGDRGAATDPSTGGDRPVLDYWRAVVRNLPEDDWSRKRFEDLATVDPHSALARYLARDPIESRPPAEPMLFPFSSNLSQRTAVAGALAHSVSVIEGPPGTGKTQTILNLIANIVATPGRTVGVVSFGNAAVDNVAEKLAAAGFGFLVAGLGRRANREAFFRGQDVATAQVSQLLATDLGQIPTRAELAALDDHLTGLRELKRETVRGRRELAAYQLEELHFAEFAARQELPRIDLPLMQRSADRILDFLAERTVREDRPAASPRLIQRIRDYVRYGSMRGLDPADTDVILALQGAFYARRVAEISDRLARAEARLTSGGLAALETQFAEVGGRVLRASLQARYRDRPRRRFSLTSYHQRFDEFARDYPVILSTCHSLRASIGEGALLDYLIIDEASQVSLPTAALAMACARNLVVVGDQAQLQHIADEAACEAAGPPPAPAYDAGSQNILSSLIELYGDALPRTRLREHYRCDPAIIGFCNAKYYGGELLAYTESTPGSRPLIAVRTAPGNHERLHRGGGRSNQREVDEIVHTVRPEFCADTADEQIAIIAAYRRQADKAGRAVVGTIDADTVHRFQGREKDVIIMTTVLSETWRGRTGLQFVDDAHLINVAVSRATKRFILVTNHDLLAMSRHISDLVGYIEYHDPENGIVPGQVISVFDLLYREYSDRLEALAARLTGESQHRSENIVGALVRGVLAEPEYHGLSATSQVRLRNLIPDPDLLPADQAAFVRHPRTSVDFLVHNDVTKRPVLAIEVDGFAYHENDPRQTARDERKDAILEDFGLPLLRLPTTGSGEEERLRAALDAALARPGGAPRPADP